MRHRPLRRILLSTVATVLGIVLLLSLKPDSYPGATGGMISAQAGPTRSPAPSHSPPLGLTSPSAAAPSVPPKVSATPPLTSPKPTATAPRAASRPSVQKTTSPPPEAGFSGTVTGRTIDTKYGPVQVRLKFSDGRIVAADAIKAPYETARSQQLSAKAIPQLNQETLAAQNADIDAVSGATYTSEGYIKSLQSALDQAGV